MTAVVGATPGHRPLRRVARGMLSTALVVAMIGFLVVRVDATAVWWAIRSVGPGGVALLVMAAAWNLVTYAFVWTAVTPGLSFGRAMTMTQATTAVSNTVPAGGAVAIGLTYSMLNSWSIPTPLATTAILVSGVWNSLAKMGLPILAVAAVALTGDVDTGRVVTGAAGIVGLLATVGVLVAALRSEAAAHRLGRWIDRTTGAAPAPLRRRAPRREDAVVRFRATTAELLGRNWPAITVATVVSHLSLLLVLLVALHVVGGGTAGAAWPEVLAVFAFARLATAVPFTPGGAGVVEAVLIGGLTATGGEPTAVTAAVLAYRTLTWALPVPLGVLAYLWWRTSTNARG